MPKINGVEYQVDSKFIESIENRLQVTLIRYRNQNRSMPVDYELVRAEVGRLYPALPKQLWYQDFLDQFCKDRKIDIPVRRR